jgi:endonuclease YncB( thermonuclease family)
VRAHRLLIAVLAALPALETSRLLARSEMRKPGDLIVGQAVAVDGETLDFPGYRLRVWGIDAPQRGSFCCRRGEKWEPAAEAAAAMSTCLAGKTITCRVQKLERHWLRTRYVSECRCESGQDLGDCMVQGGWAATTGIERRKARNKGYRLWACDNGPPTRRCDRKGEAAPCGSPTYKPSGPLPR